MDGKRSRSTVRLLDAIAVILLIMAAVLTYLHHSVDFSHITAPFERLYSMAQEQFPQPEPYPGETQEQLEEEVAQEESDGAEEAPLLRRLAGGVSLGAAGSCLGHLSPHSSVRFTVPQPQAGNCCFMKDCFRRRNRRHAQGRQDSNLQPLDS